MTQTLPGARGTAASSRSAAAPKSEQIGSVWVRGGFAAATTAALGMAALVVVVLGVWSADSQSGATAGAAIRTALALWLAGHKVPLSIPGGTMTVAPLGLTIVLGLLIARASAIVARGSHCEDARDVGTVALAVTGPYVAILTTVAVAAGTGSVHPVAPLAFVVGAVVTAGCSALGAGWGSGLRDALWRELPEWARTGTTAAGGALAVLAGTATLLTVIVLVAHQSAERAVVTGYGGVSAELSLVVMSLMLLPNAIGFALGYVAGPGFGVGTGSAVTIEGSRHGGLPSFPLSAAVPHGASVPLSVIVLLAVLGAGGTAGWLIARAGDRPLLDRLRDCAVAGAVAGVATLLVVWLAGGSVGPGAMSAFGPSLWQVPLAVAGEVGVLAAVVVGFRAWLALAGELLRAGSVEGSGG